MSDNVLSLIDLHKSYGERVILGGVTMGLDRAVNVGLIGANGAGKSTLLKIVAGLEEPEQGQVVRRGGVGLFYLEQEPPLRPGATARQLLTEPFAPLLSAIAEYEKAAVAMDERAERLLEEVERRGGWDWQHRLDRAAEEAGVDDLDRSVDIMSGGQRKRVALALMLLSNAGLLLLDEPTNHLDADTIEWLEAWLSSTTATVLLVTHDRYFLDQVVHQIAELRDGEIRTYAGHYTDYLEARAVEEEHGARVRDRRLKLLQAELEWARRSPKARTTKQKARLDRIEGAKVEQRQLQRERQMSEISFGDAPRLGKTILELVSVTKGFGDGTPTLVDRFSLIVRRGERLGVIGPNGCGKSTLLRLVAGDLEPDSGTIVRGKNTKIAWFDQERSILDPSATVRETLVPDGGDSVFPGGQRVHVATWLERFAFPTRTHGMRVGSLSGGEQNRLAIARFLLEDANLLLLDEPTNDLDLLTLNLLEAALLEFSGCVLVVTHDRYFLDKIATGIVAFEPDPTGRRQGRVTTIQGDYTHYRQVRLTQLDEERQAAAREREAARRAASFEPVKKKRSGLSWAERQELEGMEERIEAAEAEVARLEAELADPQLWSGDHARALDLNEAMEASRQEAAALFERWEELMAKQEET